MKKKTISAVIIIFNLMLGYNAYAIPQLKLPFAGGETWRCDQGNNSKTGPTHSGKLKYAWDFNFGYGNNDLGKPVLASASGIIVYAKNSNSDWGNIVIVDYGDNSYGKIDHLQKISVSEGYFVHQGVQVGTCGGTGKTSSAYYAHIHYQTQDSIDINAQSIPCAFTDTDIVRHNGIPLEGYSYISDNYIFPIGHYPDGIHTDGTSQAFADCYEKFKDFLGSPSDNSEIQCPAYGQYVHQVGSVWLQYFKQSDLSKPHYGDGETCLILNEAQEKAYLVKEGFWEKYKEGYGFDNLGAPKNNEHSAQTCNELSGANYRE